MFRDNLDSTLNDIVKSVKEGTALVKAASSASKELSSEHEKRAKQSSSISKNLVKLASYIKNDFNTVSYEDINTVITGVKQEQSYVSDNSLVKAAALVRKHGIGEKQEKVASILNAATGLTVLKNKIEKN